MTKFPRVVHCKHDPYDVYVGRPSKWGNPHRGGWCARCGKVHDRDEAIAEFEAHINQNPDLIQAAKRELRNRVLACWCAPKRCHADILLRIANER